MSPTTTIAALQTLHAAVSGVTSAPAAYPPSLEASELPCVLVYAGPGLTRWDSHGGDLKRRERTYVCRWYVRHLVSGMGIDEGMQDTLTLLEAAVALYEETDDLTNGAQIHLSDADNQAIRDSGVRSDFQYGTETYRGFEVQISVWEWTS